MSADNLTLEDRSRGGRNSSGVHELTREDAVKGGQNSPSSLTPEEAQELGESCWHAKRDEILQEFPALWEEYGDEPPKHPGGELKESPGGADGD